MSLGRLIVVLTSVLGLAGCGSSGGGKSDGSGDATGRDGGAGIGGSHGGAGASGKDGSAGLGGNAGSAGVGGSGDSSGTGGTTEVGAGSGGAGAAGTVGSGGSTGQDAGIDAAKNGDSGASSDVGVDALTDAGTGDIPEASGPPNTPTGLVASVLERRQTSVRLSWVAPATSWGGPVSSYAVRYAQVPVTQGNFDDGTVTSTFSYANAPSAVGQADGVTVKGLNIEADYYFGVASIDVWGNRSGIVATSAATGAKFLVTILSGAGTDNSGFDLDGEADLGTAGTLAFAGDGLSDLVVGATTARHVYIYFGSAGGYSTTPSITITGSADGFGRGVADAGDLDGDGLDDIAIASPSDAGGKVFIFSRKNPPASWGTTNSWPAALTDLQANYVISSSGVLAGAMFNHPLARLGDFDGAGGDDLAIGYALTSTNLGAVEIVKGGASFASRTLPDATNAIQIDGTVAGGGFGVATAGIGRFFGAAGGTTLLSTASIAGTSYAFRSQAPAGGVLSAASADDSTVGVAADRYGTPIGYLGPLGNSPGAFALAAVGGKYVDLNLGTVAMGPFLGTSGAAPAPTARFVDPASGNSFGVVNIGSGIRGTSNVVSIIGGDSLPDLVLAGQGEANKPVYLVSGAGLTSMSGTIDVTTVMSGNVPVVVKVSGKFPADWSNGFAGGCLVPDLNGDGFADFAIGEYVTGLPGRVAVFY